MLKKGYFKSKKLLGVIKKIHRNKKIRRSLKGGFVRDGSHQHFRKPSSSLKNYKKKRSLKGGFVRDGSHQHFRKSSSTLKNYKKNKNYAF